MVISFYTLSQAQVILAVHELITGPELRFSREDCVVLRDMLAKEAGSQEWGAQNTLIAALITYFDKITDHVDRSGEDA